MVVIVERRNIMLSSMLHVINIFIRSMNYTMHHFLTNSKSYLLIAFTTLLYSCSTTTSIGQSKLSPNDFDKQLKATSSPQLLDVRTPDEYHSGHIENANNFNIYAGDFNQKLDLLDKSDTIFVYCKAGGRSNDAAKRLTAKGFTHVYDLDGGMMKWQQAKLPVVGGPETKVGDQHSIADYDSIVASKPLVVVDFYAPWCGPCKLMSPYLERMKAEYTEDQLMIVKIDVDQNPSLTQHFSISGIPLVKIYHNGEMIIEKLGLVKESEMRELLKPYLN